MPAGRATPNLLPTTVVGSYPQPDWLVDRERLGDDGAAGAGAASSGGCRAALARRGAGRRHARSRSATWSGPGSTSSPTARSGARAIRTTSRPRSRASTSSTRRPSPGARAGPSRCRGSPAGSGGRARSRCAAVAFLRVAHPAETNQGHAAGAVHAVSAGRRTSTRRRGGAWPSSYAAAVNEEVHDLFVGRRRRRSAR